MKFLVIRFSSIGDIILTTPVIRCLKKQLPQLELHYLTKPQFKPILSNNPYIDKIHLLQQDWKGMIEELKEEKFDFIIDLHHNLRTLRIKKDLKVPYYSFNKLNLQKLVYVKLKWNVLPNEHIVDRYMDTVKPFGVVNDGEGLDYFIPKEEETSLKDIPASHHAGYIALVIGASFKTKKLPVFKLQELCNAIKHPIMLLGGKDDVEEGEAVSQLDPIKIYNACGKFSLNESADLVKKARVVITHDTGLMHVAAAFKKPIIAIWGSTVPSFGMGPYYGKNFFNYKPANYFENVQVEKLWCRPCTKIGRHKCPQGHFKCMKNIAINEIVSSVNAKLKLG